MRRIFIALLTLLLVLVCAGILGEALRVRDEMTYGVVDPLTADSLPFRDARLGVNAELTRYADDQLAQQLALMRQAGIVWVRQFIYWDEVEPERGTYDWAAYDRVIHAVASEEGLRLVAVLMNTPSWARDPAAPDDPTAPPIEPADFAAFAAAFAARYADQVDFVQVWDEPNLFTNWGRIAPRAARYVALLTDAYHAIHAADPHVTVIAAALAPTIELGPDNISELVFLRDMYTFGAREVMDAVAGKPYGFDFSPDDRRVHDRLLNFSRFSALRAVMDEHGDSDTPLWGSHWGWNALPDDWAGQPSIWGSVRAEERIAYTLRALERAEDEWPWAGGLILHHWNPPYPADHPQQGFALTTPDGQPTDLLMALMQRPSPAHAAAGWHGVRNPDAAYSGVWTFSEAGADIGWLRDSRLTFTFTGTDVGLILRQDDYVAHLYVTVDGQPANALPRDAAGNAYIVLSSGSRQPSYGPVAVARDLPYGDHTVEVIADQGFDRYALAGYAVGAGNVRRTYDAWVIGAAGSLGLALCALVASILALPVGIINQRLRRVFAALSFPVQLTISGITSFALMIALLLTPASLEPPLLRREPVLPLITLVSSGILYLNFLLPLSLLAGIVLFWCIYQRLSLGLMLALFYAPFFLFPVELYRFAFPMVEIVTLITFAAWTLKMLADWGRRRKSGESAPPLRLHTFDYLALAYMVLGVLALFWSAYRGFALTELRTLFIEPLLFYLVFRTTPLDERDRRMIVLAFLASGVTVAGISLMQYVRGEAIITAEDASRRLAGVYGSPNNLALFLGRCLPFALAGLLLARERRTRALLAVAGLIMLAAFVLTQSVGGIFIGLPAAIVVVLLMAYRRRALPALVILALLTAAAFALAASQSDRFARALDFTQGTNFYRVRVMQSAAQMIADRPLTGLGLDQFLYAFRDTYIYPDAWPEPDLSHPHNILLDFWVRLGLGGALLAVALVIAGARLSLRAVRRAVDRPFWAWVAVGLAGALADTLAHGLLDNSVFVIDLVYVFWGLIAVGIGIDSARTPSDAD